MENAGSWTVSGSKETMEVPKNFKDLQKRGVRNKAQYSAANVPFPALFCSTGIHFFHTLRHIYGSVWPAKLSLALVPCSYVLRMIMTLAYAIKISPCSEGGRSYTPSTSVRNTTLLGFNSLTRFYKRNNKNSYFAKKQMQL